MTDPIESTTGVEIDPSNGFEVLWTKSNKYALLNFSLIKVPIDTPVRIVYSLDSAGVYLSFVPSHHPRKWVMNGKLSFKAILSLGYHTGAYSIASRDPRLTSEDLHELERYGISNIFDGLDYFHADDSHIPSSSVYQFLYSVWRPGYINAVGIESERPIYLGEQNSSGNSRKYRLLPQKFPHVGKVDITSQLAIERVI